MSSERPEDVVELPGAGVPADRGLSSLGLLMQLAGGTFAALGALAAVVAFLALRDVPGGPPGEAGWVFAAVALCTTRSLVHRAAGARLLYGGRQRADGSAASPLEGVRCYIAVALGQTALLALLLRAKLDMPAAEVAACSAGLALWPLVLAGILASGALAPFAAEIPCPEDKGFEGAAILMAVLGAAGAAATGAILIADLGAGSAMIVDGPGIVAVAALGLLLLRSCLQVQAGLGGLRETSLDRSVELASRYAEFGVVSSLWFGAVLLLAAIANGMNVWGMALVSGLCWLMMMWPLIVRRFFRDRQFADLIAGDRAQLHRRAPDAGLSGLGWLLVGHATLTASFLVPQLVAGPGLAGDARWLAWLAGGLGEGSPWASAGAIALEAWAGAALLCRGAHHRWIAAGYGAVGTVLTCAAMAPIAERAMALSVLGGAGERLVLSLALIAIQLAIPAAALVLATRAIVPAARARYRRRGPEGRAP